MNEEQMERRLQYLTRTVSSQGERIAKLETLEPAIVGLKASVDDLTAALNRGKGAVWVVGVLGIAIGTVMSWVVAMLRKA